MIWDDLFLYVDETVKVYMRYNKCFLFFGFVVKHINKIKIQYEMNICIKNLGTYICIEKQCCTIH
jgi:hypothetical protein